MSIPDWIGMMGVALILLAYGLLQAQKVSSTDLAFSACNALGAGLILVSLAFDFNLPAMVIESAWLVISLYGLLRSRTRAK